MVRGHRGGSWGGDGGGGSCRDRRGAGRGAELGSLRCWEGTRCLDSLRWIYLDTVNR